MAIMSRAPARSNPANSGPFANMGEQLVAVRQAAYTNSWTAQRARARLDLVERAAGSSEQVPSDGSFLLQPEFSRDIAKRMYETGDIYSRCLEMPITTNSIKFPKFDETSRANGSRLGGVQCFLENEAAALVASKPAFSASELVPKKITGLLYVTEELAADSEAFATWAEYAFSQESMFTFENLIVNGTGAGQPLGVMNSTALVSVAKQTGQGSGTISSQNIQAMLTAFWAKSYNSSSACFLFNQGLLPQLASLPTIVGAAGSESKMWAWAGSSDDYDKLAGFPAIMCEYCAVPGTPGDIILADFSRYVVALRERLRSEVSIHVKFLTDELAFRFIMRADGQPIDSVPVTPLNGTTATSPFVALAQR